MSVKTINKFEYTTLAVLADTSIKDIKDLVRFKNISSMHAEVVEDYIYDVWKRLMTQENFNESARRGFEMFADKWIDFKRADPKFDAHKLSSFQAMFYAIKHDHYDFYIKLKPYIDVPPGTDVALGILLGKQEFVEACLDNGAPTNVIITQQDIFRPRSANAHLNGRNIWVERLIRAWFCDEYDKDNYGFALVDRHRDSDFQLIYGSVDQPLLYTVAQTGNLPFIKSLIERGFEPKDSFDDNLDTYGLLTHAFLSGNEELVHYLYPLVNIWSDDPKERFNWGWLSGRMKELYGRLLPTYEWGSSVTIPTDLSELNVFNQGECMMFINASKNQTPLEFVRNICVFGNTTYYPLAQLVLEQNVGSDDKLIMPQAGRLDMFFELEDRGGDLFINYMKRNGTRPLIERLKELGALPED